MSDVEEEAFHAYRRGGIFLSEAVSRLGVDPWTWFDLLRRRNETLNVELEDWIDSSRGL